MTGSGSQYDLLRESKPSQAKWRICWQSRITGATGHDEYCLSYDEATAEVARLNREVPELHHWSEINLNLLRDDWPAPRKEPTARESAILSIVQPFAWACTRVSYDALLNPIGAAIREAKS